MDKKGDLWTLTKCFLTVLDMISSISFDVYFLQLLSNHCFRCGFSSALRISNCIKLESTPHSPRPCSANISLAVSFSFLWAAVKSWPISDVVFGRVRDSTASQWVFDCWYFFLMLHPSNYLSGGLLLKLLLSISIKFSCLSLTAVRVWSSRMGVAQPKFSHTLCKGTPIFPDKK